MKGEKGMPGVSVGEGLGEELADDSFSKWMGDSSLRTCSQIFIFLRHRYCIGFPAILAYHTKYCGLWDSVGENLVFCRSANTLPAGIITADGQQQNVMVYTTSYQQVSPNNTGPINSKMAPQNTTVFFRNITAVYNSI